MDPLPGIDLQIRREDGKEFILLHVSAGAETPYYSAKYRQEHEDEIVLHRAAKQAFDALGVQKLPSVKSLNAQYARLLGEKKAAYAEYRAAREEMRELMVHRKNLALILQGDEKEGKGKEAEREGR